MDDDNEIATSSIQVNRIESGDIAKCKKNKFHFSHRLCVPFYLVFVILSQVDLFVSDHSLAIAWNSFPLCKSSKLPKLISMKNVLLIGFTLFSSMTRYFHIFPPSPLRITNCLYECSNYI